MIALGCLHSHLVGYKLCPFFDLRSYAWGVGVSDTEGK